jgi:starch-binding outer membrane protein, SusD/RagB family
MKFQYIILFALLSLWSCEDKLELNPEQSISGEVALSSEAGIANILIGAYDETGQAATHGGRLQMISDLLGTDVQTSWRGTFAQPAEISIRVILSDNSFVRDFWNNAYEVINQCNLVLDNLSIVSDEKKGLLEGEARFLRALNYFELNAHFNAEGKGVPLRLKGISDYAVDLSIARAPTADVYALVLSDLATAVNLLPADNGFFADKYAAQALLARVNLYLGNYAAARDAAHDVLENSGHSLAADFAGAFNNNSDGPEDIFAMQVTSQTGSNELITFYASQGNGGRGGDITVNDEYVALFDDPNDERASFFYTSPQNGGRLTSKYTNQFGNVPILRIAEMHLIRAEANLELGTSLGLAPLDEINALRGRSGAGPLAGINKAGILLERQLELAFEGFLIHDIKRSGGSVDGIAASDPRLTLPIPIAEMDTNPLMAQNPGY